jgi:hypothetical protein
MEGFGGMTDVEGAVASVEASIYSVGNADGNSVIDIPQVPMT